MNTTVFYGDAMGQVWWMWSKAHGLWNGNTTALLSAPFGYTREYAVAQPVYEALFSAAARIFPEIVAYNLIVLVSFPLTALATFLFLDYLLKDRVAAFLGGAFFGFCSGAVSQACAGHLTFALNMFIPLFVWAFLVHRKYRTIHTSALLGLVYALLALTCTYWGYFGVLLGVTMLVFDFFQERSLSLSRKAFGYVPAFCVAALLLLSVFYPLLMFRLRASHTILKSTGFAREIEQLVVYSAYPWEYFMPSIQQLVFGPLVGTFFSIFLHGSNVFEQSIYLGALPLLFVGWGLVLIRDGDFSEERRRYFFFFLIIGAVLMLISFPPYFPVKNIKIPNISFVLYQFAPMFRVYARLGIFVMFFVACAGAVVIAALRDRVPFVQRKRFVLIVLAVFVVDTWSVSPDLFARLNTPPVYEWLAQQPGDIVVAEYPMMSRDDASYYRYLLWQRVHKKRIVNGASPVQKEAWEFRESVADFSRSETVAALRKAGVKYAIVHAAYYAEGPIPKPMKPYFPPKTASLSYDHGRIPKNTDLSVPYRWFGSDIVYAL